MQILTTQELLQWCKAKHGRICKMALKSNQNVSTFSSVFLDLNYPVNFDEKSTIEFRQHMREIENESIKKPMQSFKRRKILSNWFTAIKSREKEYQRLNNGKCHCISRDYYKSDIKNSSWKHYRRCMKTIEENERVNMAHWQQFEAWAKSNQGDLLTLSKAIGIPRKKLNLVLDTYSVHNYNRFNVDWDLVFEAVQKLQSNSDRSLVIRGCKSSLSRRYLFWDWLHLSKGRSSLMNRVTGAYYTEFLKHPSSFKFDYTDNRWEVLTGAMHQIEEFENYHIFMSVLFSIWFLVRPSRVKSLKKVIGIDERSCRRYRKISYNNNIQALSVDWFLILEGMEQVEIYEKAKKSKKEYSLLSESIAASKKRKAEAAKNKMAI